MFLPSSRHSQNVIGYLPDDEELEYNLFGRIILYILKRNKHPSVVAHLQNLDGWY